MVDVEDQGQVKRVGAGGQGFLQDAVAPDVLEGDTVLVPAEVVGEVAGGDRSGAQGAFAREQDVPVGASSTSPGTMKDHLRRDHPTETEERSERHAGRPSNYAGLVQARSAGHAANGKLKNPPTVA